MCTRLVSKGNSVPVHQGVRGNEAADDFAKAAAEGADSGDAVPDEYRWETSLWHMTRVSTEARTRPTQEWIRSHVWPERRYQPPQGRGVRRRMLRWVRKSLAGRYYQLLSGHASIGSFLHERAGSVESSACWWCESEATVATPPLHRVYDVDTADQETLEEGSEGLQMEAPAGMGGEKVVE